MMEREEILDLVRTHLADELGIDSDSITDASNLRDDLEADSLDLYTLLQEVEDRLGVKIADDQAADIETVGQAVDLIIATGPQSG
jgi:acyl carrier protein